MKGGVRLYFTLHNNISQKNWPWWREVWDFTLQYNTSQKNWPWWRVVWDFTSHNNTSQKNWPWWRAVWDFTWQNNTSQKNWPCWRVLCDFALHNNTSQKNWPWWRVVCDFTLHYITIYRKRIDLDEGRCETLHYNTIHRKRIDLDEGGVRLYTTIQYITKELSLTHCNGCMNVAWALLWGGSRSTKPCVFPCKVVAGGDERYLVCVRRLRLRSVCLFFCRSGTVASSCCGCACLCVRSYRVWSVGREERSEKCEVWSVKCGVLRAQCEVQCEVQCGVRRVQCEVWSVECRVWSVECEECSEKCEVRSGTSNVTCETGHNCRRMHARTGLAGARRIKVL